MKRSWTIRRRAQELPDGQRRWDQAYQHLLRWALSADLEEKRLFPSEARYPQEVSDESGSVCTGVDTAPGPGAFD